ncbi:MAG: acyl-CoA dehydrogenase family protein, partial [Marmoricola sp.]
MAVDLDAAKAALDVAHSVVASGTAKLAEGSIDDQQVLAYDLAHAAAAVRAGESMLAYAAKGDVEAQLTVAFIADVIADVSARLLGREELWGISTGALDAAHGFAATYRDPAFLAGLALEDGPRHLDEDFIPVQDVFRKFAEEKIKPLAEGVHRSNGDIPEELIQGLAELGVFGMSVPEEYDGFSSGGENE